MTATQSPGSPLARLVLFIVCMAVAAGILAGVLSFIGNPAGQQQAIQPPENKFVAPWYDPDCTERCNNLYLAHTIGAAAWTACLSTCCGGGITC